MGSKFSPARAIWHVLLILVMSRFRNKWLLLLRWCFFRLILLAVEWWCWRFSFSIDVRLVVVGIGVFKQFSLFAMTVVCTSSRWGLSDSTIASERREAPIILTSSRLFLTNSQTSIRWWTLVCIHEFLLEWFMSWPCLLSIKRILARALLTAFLLKSVLHRWRCPPDSWRLSQSRILRE